MQKVRKYKIGLVIGRFQPFHLGHKFLIDESLKIADKIIIGIGSSNKSDEKNPWDSKTRKKMVSDFVNLEGLSSRVVKIILLHDNPDDDVWFANLVKKTGPFDVTIGNNPWNNGIIERHGIPAVEIGFKNRRLWEGVKIRRLIKNRKKWEDRVPQYLVKNLTY